MFVNVDGDIYVDNGYSKNRVDKWTRNSTIGECVLNVHGSCTGLFIDGNQNLYCSLATAHRVMKFNLTNSSVIGTHQVGTGCPGPLSNMLDYPHGIFVDSDFNLYVADTNNNRIQRFVFGESNGHTVAGFESSIHFILNRPTGIILDGNNYLFIVDSHNHRIIRSVPNEFRCIVGCSDTSGDAPYQLHYPHSMAFDTSGNIVVTDLENRRIQRFYLTSNSCGKSIH